MLRTGVRVVAAAVLAAAAYVAQPLTPASAAGCSTAHGVTVVVDFHELGGGVQSGCVLDGGGDVAAELFPAAGFSLSYVQRQPGFVCRVDGAPADDPCVNTPPPDAYWALFWSDGKSGSWSYASSGAPGLRVPEGGYVAFSWNGSSGRAVPGYSPAPHPTATPTPSPTRNPTHQASPSSQPSQQQSAGSSTASAAPSESPTESAQAAPAKKPRGQKGTRTPEPTPSETTTAVPTEAATDDAVPASVEPSAADDADDGGLPAWVAPAVIAVLFAGTGAAAVVRRRRGVPGA